MTDHIERTKRMIEVMQAYVDGDKVEYNGLTENKFAAEPTWNWEYFNYRIAKTPDAINWDHVAPEFKYMARDENHFPYFYKNKPFVEGDGWSSNDCIGVQAKGFSSYRKGTVDWKESLVIRPGCE